MPEAFYRFRAEIVRRGPQRGMKSALVAAAYRSGQKLQFEREEQAIDYSRRSGVVMTGILAPEHAPGWMLDRENLWNVIENKEKRCDARLARDFTLSLPHQLNEAQRQEAVTGFLEKQFVARGLVCDFAIHSPHEEGDTRNHHAHVLVTERAITPDGFSPKKDRGLNERGKITQWRQAWQDELNRIFERDQVRDRSGDLYFVDQRSYKERGIDKEATRHMGPGATALERDGVETEVGKFNRRVTERNVARERLNDDLERVEEEIALAERQQEKARRLFGDVDAGNDNAPMTEEAAARRKAQMRELLGEGDEVGPRQDGKETRRAWRKAGLRIDDPQPRLKPKPRDFGL